MVGDCCITDAMGQLSITRGEKKKQGRLQGRKPGESGKVTKIKCQLLRGRKESGERQRGKEKENDKVEKVSETL